MSHLIFESKLHEKPTTQENVENCKAHTGRNVMFCRWYSYFCSLCAADREIGNLSSYVTFHLQRFSVANAFLGHARWCIKRYGAAENQEGTESGF